MIKSKFSLIHDISFDKGEILVIDACADDCFYIYFTGNTVEFVEGISPNDIYSRLLICWDKDVKELFFIMKTNKIYNISSKDTEVIDYLVTNGITFLNVEDINTILEFIKL